MPRLIVDRPAFRIVEGDDGAGYLLEVPDGCDGLGVERWRTFKLYNAQMDAMFKFMIEMALLQERTHAENK